MGDPNNFVTRIRIICCDPDNFVADPEHFDAAPHNQDATDLD